MSQTDITYLSAEDLLGRTDRTRLITVEIPELADDEGNPGIVLLRPPTAAMAQSFMKSFNNQALMAKVKAGQTEEMLEDIEMAGTFEIFGRLVRDLAVTADRKRLFSADLSSQEILDGMPAPVLTRLIHALSGAIAAQAEEGSAKSKKSKKTPRSASATSSPGGAE